MQKNQKQKAALLGALLVLAVVVGVGAYSSEDLQGAVKSKSKSKTTTTTTSTSSSGSSMSVSTNTTGQNNCTSDEMQSFTMQADGSAEYNKQYVEHAFNELFDDIGFNDVLEAALMAELPNIESVTNPIIATDHPNYFENGETGSLAVEYKYNNNGQYPVHSGKFVQKVAVTAEDEGLFFRADIELTDGTKFYLLSQIVNATVNYNIYTPLAGDGYTLSSSSIIVGSGSESQGAAYGKNIVPASSTIRLTSFTGTFDDDATVQRTMPDGNNVDDPILQAVVREVLEDNPISITSSSSAFSSVESSLAAITDPHIMLASLAGWTAAKQSVTDGISSSYVPVMAFYQESKVKMHACASASDFDSSTLSLPYVTGGTTHGN